MPRITNPNNKTPQLLGTTNTVLKLALATTVSTSLTIILLTKDNFSRTFPVLVPSIIGAIVVIQKINSHEKALRNLTRK